MLRKQVYRKALAQGLLRRVCLQSLNICRFCFVGRLTLLSLALILLVSLAQGQTVANTATPASTAISSTNAPASTPPTAVALPEVVSEAQSTLDKLHEMDLDLSSDETIKSVDENLSEITLKINEQQAVVTKPLDASSSPAGLRSAQSAWRTLSRNLGILQKTLVDRVTLLDAQLKQLNTWTQSWQATLSVAKSSVAPPEIQSKIDSVLTAIAETTKTTESQRSQTLSEQERVAEQGARVQEALTNIEKARANAVGELFTRNSTPLWSLDVRVSSNGAVRDSFAAQIVALKSFVHDKVSIIIFQCFGFVLLAMALIWLRGEFNARLKQDASLQHTAAVFEIPLVTAALLALLLSNWLYPSAPRLFTSIIEAAALIPSVVILRRFIGVSLHSILYAMVLSFFFDQIRRVASSTEIESRGLFIFELLAATIFLACLIRTRRLRAQSPSHPLERIIELSAHVVMLLIVVAGLSNALGYGHLSFLLGNATFSSSYLAVILYAAVRIMDGLILSALQIPPLSRFDLIKHHHALLARAMFRFLRWAATLFWLWETLDLFSLRSLAWAKTSALLTHKIGWGSYNLTPGDVIAFGLAVWASFLVSKIIRSALEEELYPHLHLPEGVPYTASTLVHYAVLVIGFFMALEFLGIKLSNFAVLAGAFGVGLGFGLQTIMNNFFSGIILLFERPIKIGDIIQLDSATGTVENIGIRASIVRLADGSGAIVPNANLISNQVINWTFSNRQRMVVVPVTVVSKTEPQKVMALLVEVAQKHPLVLKSPSPRAIVTNFTAAALSLELHAWTDAPGEWVQIRSDLSVALNANLLKENIAIG